MENSKKNLRKFLLNVVLVRFKINKSTASNDSNLKWQLIVSDQCRDLTSDRVCVKNFPPTPLYKFILDPCDLCHILYKTGIGIKVLKNHNVVGIGYCTLPSSLLASLFDEVCLLTHVIECEIFKPTVFGEKTQEVIGMVELNIRITSEIFNVGRMGLAANKLPFDICKASDESLGPNDVLFVLGHSPQVPTTMSCVPEQRLLIPGQKAFIGIKNKQAAEAPQVERLIAGAYTQAGDNKLPSEQYCRCAEMETTTTSSSKLNSDEYKKVMWTSADSKDDDMKTFMPVCPKLELPELTHLDFNAIRICDVCKTNVSWLPKYAACPYCNYKPLPEIIEKPYDVDLTAEQIIMDFCNKQNKETAANNEYAAWRENNRIVENVKGKQCSFSNGGPCANCRIRQICQKKFRKTTQNERKATPIKLKPDAIDEKFEKTYKRAVKKKDSIQNICNEIFHAAQRKSKKKKVCHVAQRKSKKKKVQKKHTRSTCGKRRRRMIKSHIYTMVPKRRKSRTRIGHRNCTIDSSVGKYKKVPCHMGWLWSLDSNLRKRNWKPGAISKPIKEIMAYFLSDFPADTLNVSRYCHRRKNKNENSNKFTTNASEQLPVLHIIKKHNEYIISLRPLKRPSEILQCNNPYLDMKPIRFRIVKNKAEAERCKLKKIIEKLGFKKCTCHRPIVDCFCRSFIEKKNLLAELQHQCDKLKIDNPENSIVFDESSDSEEEYDFGITPPAGVLRTDFKPKVNMVNAETQYDIKDWCLPYKYNPAVINPYISYGSCATNERNFTVKSKSSINCAQSKDKICLKRKASMKKSAGTAATADGIETVANATRLEAGAEISTSANFRKMLAPLSKKRKCMSIEERTKAAFFDARSLKTCTQF